MALMLWWWSDDACLFSFENNKDEMVGNIARTGMSTHIPDFSI